MFGVKTAISHGLWPFVHLEEHCMLVLWQIFEKNQGASSFSLIEIQLAFKEPYNIK